MNRRSIGLNEIIALKLSFWAIFLNTVVESFLLYFEDRFTIIILQFCLNLVLFISVPFFGFNLRFSRYFIAPFLIFIQFLVLTYFSTDQLLSLNMTLKFMIPFGFLVIGYSMNSPFLLKYLSNNLWIYLAYFVFYFIIVNYNNIGFEMYLGGVKTGYYSLNGLYVPVFAVIYLLFFNRLIDGKGRKVLSFTFSLLTIAITVAILKRTLLFLLFIALFFFLLKNFSFKLFLRVSFTSLCLGLVFYLYFSNLFATSMQSRESRFNKDYDITQEGRITENYYVFSTMKDNPLHLLFGTGEIFNDRKYIAKIFYEEDREIHSSYARLFWNGGIFALLLFIYFYFVQLRLMKRSYSYSRQKSRFYEQLFYFGVLMIFLRILNDFSSGITYLGFNSFCYFIIGYLIKLGQQIESLRSKGYHLGTKDLQRSVYKKYDFSKIRNGSHP